MREIYFDDHINDSEYSGKLLRSRTDVYSIKRARGSGAGGGVIIAERDDRGSVQDTHNETPRPTSTGVQQALNLNTSFDIRVYSTRNQETR